MQTEMPLSHNQRVHEIAAENKRRGYTVWVGPTAKRRPEFLKPFEPDIIAEGPGESVVIEINTRNPDRVDYWRQLAETIRLHSGWRFELILEPAPGPVPPTSLDKAAVDARLEEGLRLAEAQHLEASLLILWSSAEAAMRLVAITNEVDLPDTRPSTVITRLYTNGFTEREEYDLLMHCMRLSDALAHGFQTEPITTDLIQSLNTATVRLLTEELGSEQRRSEHAA